MGVLTRVYKYIYNIFIILLVLIIGLMFIGTKPFNSVMLIINLRRMQEGYGSHSVYECVCVCYHNSTCDQYFCMKLAPLYSAHIGLLIYAKNSLFFLKIPNGPFSHSRSHIF